MCNCENISASNVNLPINSFKWLDLFNYTESSFPFSLVTCTLLSHSRNRNERVWSIFSFSPFSRVNSCELKHQIIQSTQLTEIVSLILRWLVYRSLALHFLTLFTFRSNWKLLITHRLTCWSIFLLNHNLSPLHILIWAGQAHFLFFVDCLHYTRQG